MELTFMAKVDPVAAYAAIIATVALIWQIISRWRDGPRLRVDVSSKMQLFGTALPDDNIYVMVKVTNIGKQPTTITNLCLKKWKNRDAKNTFMAAEHMIVTHPNIPGSSDGEIPSDLQSGKQWTGTFKRNADINFMIENELIYVGVAHVMSKKIKWVRLQD